LDLWFTEEQTRYLKLSFQVKEVLENKHSHYQNIAVLDTENFGKVLILDGYIQVTQLDEFIYHEMIAHVPLITHENPENVLIIGGGDGGTAREALKHPTVKKITLVEIDREVVEVCRRLFPETSASLEDSRIEVICEDGFSFLKNTPVNYDVIIVDSTEPVGPAQSLFSYDFYQTAKKALQDKGIVVAQTESPFYNRELLQQSLNHVKNLYPLAGLYLAPIPSYPGGLWSFTLGSKGNDPRQINYTETCFLKHCQYYSQEIHKNSFILPPYFEKFMEDME